MKPIMTSEDAELIANRIITMIGLMIRQDKFNYVNDQFGEAKEELIRALKGDGY